MSYLAYDFEGDTVGQKANGWANSHGTADTFLVASDSGNVLRSSTTFETIYCTDIVSAVGTVRVDGTFEIIDATAAAGIWLRHTGDAENDGYLFYFTDDGDYVAIWKYIDGVYDSQVAISAAGSIVPGTQYNFVVEATGTTLRAWFGTGTWDGSTWLASGTDATFATGFVMASNHVGDVQFGEINILSNDIPITPLYFKFKDTAGGVIQREILDRMIVSSASTTYTLAGRDEFVNMNATGGALTVNLPTAMGKSGYVYGVQKTDSSTNAVTLDADTTETIDGAPTIALTTQNEAVLVMSDGYNWHVIASDQRSATKTTACPVCLASYIDVKARNTEYNIHGGLDSLATAQPLDSVPTDLPVTVGTGKVMIVINAGSDLAGDITVTGTTVDRNTGAETGADTDTITVDALTTDGSDTDASGNTRHSFTGAYITSKWFKGSVVLSTANLTLSDVDVYQVSFEQWNDSADVEIESFDITALATNGSAWLYAYLYTLEVTGDKCNITRSSTLDLPAAEVSANKYYRLRRGNLGLMIDGSTDGNWIDLFPGPLASTYWEDINVKLWGTITKELVLS